MKHGLVVLSRLAAPREPLDSGIYEAREAFEFWSRRASNLPWHRRAARREAQALAGTWRARLVTAHLTRWRFGRAAASFSPLLDTKGRTVGGSVGRFALTSLRRTRFGRRLLLVAGVAGMLAVILVAASVVLIVGAIA